MLAENERPRLFYSASRLDGRVRSPRIEPTVYERGSTLSEEPDPGALVSSILDGAVVKPESVVALLHAVAVAKIEGVGGALVIRLPRKPSAPVEVSFTTGTVSVRIEP